MEAGADLLNKATGLAGFISLICLVVMGMRGARVRSRNHAMFRQLQERQIQVDILKERIAELEFEIRDRFGHSQSDHQEERVHRPEPEPNNLRRQEIVSLAALGLSTSGFHPKAAIRKAYRINIKRTHPDQGGNVVEFQAVRHALDFLIENHPVRPGL